MVRLNSKNIEVVMTKFKKCPACNSSRLTRVISDGVMITTCQRCYYQHKPNRKF